VPIRDDVMPLRPDFSVRLDPSPPGPFAGKVEAEIDRLWAARLDRQGPTLFNGRILSLVAATPAELVVRAMEYRHLIAAADAPELAPRIGIEPLGVTGLLLCLDGLVLGLRADTMASAAGCWEPVPAGGLDRPDPAAVLLTELEEEAGLSPQACAAPHPLALLHDADCGTSDIIYRLTCPLSARDVAAAHRAKGSDEYTRIAAIAVHDLPAFLDRHAGRLTTTAAVLGRPGFLQKSLRP